MCSEPFPLPSQETITTVEIDDETYEEIIKVGATMQPSRSCTAPCRGHALIANILILP